MLMLWGDCHEKSASIWKIAKHFKFFTQLSHFYSFHRRKRQGMISRKLAIPGSGRSLKKGMTTHFSILAWRIPRTKEPSGLQSMGHKELDMTEQITLSLARSQGLTSLSPVHGSWSVCLRLRVMGLWIRKEPELGQSLVLHVGNWWS